MGYMGNKVSMYLGQMGIMTDLPPGDIPSGALIDAKNITLERGIVQKAPGTLIYNTSHVLDSGIVAMFDWWPSPHLQRLIVATSNGSIYRDIGDRTFTSATPITTGLGVLTPNTIFIEGGLEAQGEDKKLFFFSNGLRQIKVLAGDGLSFSDIADPAADWTSPNFPTIGLVHRNRLWAFMEQAAYASDTANHENFLTNNLIQYIYPGEGGKIMGAYVYKGRLFVFKEGGFVYYLDESDSDSSNWYWKKLISNFGLASPNGIFQALDDLIVVNDTGTLTSYAATDAFGDIESADLMRNMQMEGFLRNNFSLSGLSEAHAIYYAAKKQAFITYRSSYSNSNDMLWVIDVNKQNPSITYWLKGSPQCLAMRKSSHGISRPIYGSLDGYVHQMDYEDRLEGSASFTGSFQTKHEDFRGVDSNMANQQKHFDFLWLEYIAEGNWTVSVDVFIDGVFRETVSVPMQAQGNYLDEFLLDTDYLAQRVTQSNPVPLHGTGRRISFKIYNSGSNQSFQISSVTVGFRVGSDGSSKL